MDWTWLFCFQARGDTHAHSRYEKLEKDTFLNSPVKDFPDFKKYLVFIQDKI